MTGGRYRAPRTPGASTEILPESLEEYSLSVRPRVARRDALTVDLGPLVFGGAPIGGLYRLPLQTGQAMVLPARAKAASPIRRLA